MSVHPQMESKDDESPNVTSTKQERKAEEIDKSDLEKERPTRCDDLSRALAEVESAAAVKTDSPPSGDSADDFEEEYPPTQLRYMERKERRKQTGATKSRDGVNASVEPSTEENATFDGAGQGDTKTGEKKDNEEKKGNEEKTDNIDGIEKCYCRACSAVGNYLSSESEYDSSSEYESSDSSEEDHII